MEASTATTGAPEAAEPAVEVPAPDAETQAPETDAGEATGERDEGGKFLSRERLAGDAGLQVPSDVWTFGAELSNLRTEDGSIDPETVNELVGEIVKDRPGLQTRPVGDLGIGRGAAAAGTTHAPEVGLSQLLKPEGR